VDFGAIFGPFRVSFLPGSNAGWETSHFIHVTVTPSKVLSPPTQLVQKFRANHLNLCGEGDKLDYRERRPNALNWFLDLRALLFSIQYMAMKVIRSTAIHFQQV
jgi:hypothetical protein